MAQLPVKKKKNKAKKKVNYLLCIAVMLFLGLGGVWSVLSEDRALSELENRKLQQFPTLSWSTLWSGQYGQELESWFEDQFPGRESAFHANYLVRKSLNQHWLNGQYLGKGTLIGALEAPDEQIFEANIQAVNDFALKSNLPTALMMVPPAEMIEQDKLPAFAPVPDLTPYFEQITQDLTMATNLDLRDVLFDHQEDYLFYRTDHHWATQGAGFGAQALVAFCEGELDLKDYTYQTLSTNFEGTSASYTGSVGLYDSIIAAKATDLPSYQVAWGNGRRSDSVYVPEALEQKNQYAYFLGENEGLVQILTQANTGRHLLLIKDSYANIMVQYLLPFYDSILVVDPRYYGDDLNALVQQNPLTHIAFVLSYQSFREAIELAPFAARLADIPLDMESTS